MKAFIVSVNGQKVATLGVGGDGLLTATIHWTGGRPAEIGGEFFMMLGGLAGEPREHLLWPAPPLNVGDEVSIRLAEVEQVDPPAERTPSTPVSPELLAEAGIAELLEESEREEARNRMLSTIRARVAGYLKVWLDQQPEPQGQVLCGEASVQLRRDPDTTVGADVVYVSAEVMARQSGGAMRIDGVPVVAVLIPSPKDTQQVIHDKIDGCLAAGVPLIWMIDPHRQTIKIYQPGAEPEMANMRQELSGEPHLPGFRVPVAQLFA